MKKIFAIGLAGILSAAGLFAEQVLNGAGASFPAPVYQAWSYGYTQASGGVRVNYQSMGSGAGINQIKSGTVDFAGTDSPLSSEELAEAGLLQFPMLMGGVTPVVNIPGVKSNELKLTPEVLADIFMGKISRWNAPEIAALNPGLKLPPLKITVVRRGDAAGTTFIFTDYLCKASSEWAEKIGSGTTVDWPVGIGGQKNPGVCNNVRKIRGSIGYAEYTYAVESKLATVQLMNHDGIYVKPDLDSFSAAAANADWANAPGLSVNLNNQPGENSWPITGVTYILLRKDCAPEVFAALKEYFHWCFESGAVSAYKLNYVALPASVVEIVNQKIFK